MLLLPILLFVFSTALFVGSVQPNEEVEFIEGANYYRTKQILKAKIAEGYEIVSSANTGRKDYNSNPELFLWTLVKKDDDDNDDEKKKQNVDLMQKIDTLIEKIDNDKKEQHLDNFVGKVETLGHKFDILIEKIDQDRKEQQKSVDTLVEKINQDRKEQQKTVDTLVKAISSLVEQLDKKSGKLTLW
ncbi:hypothetical protein niasHS_006104 [Heterodera schachtii]|uniref:Uncharacterized protein n=1 Tax=Heterodera schachtii TaxID=97005 RepID=A0ABD2JWL3_HETSC